MSDVDLDKRVELTVDFSDGVVITVDSNECFYCETRLFIDPDPIVAVLSQLGYTVQLEIIESEKI